MAHAEQAQFPKIALYQLRRKRRRQIAGVSSLRSADCSWAHQTGKFTKGLFRAQNQGVKAKFEGIEHGVGWFAT
jgi:hypothetical protein